MPDKNLHLALSNTQISDLLNTLEDHRNISWTKPTRQLRASGFGLEISSWATHAQEVNEARQLIQRSAKT